MALVLADRVLETTIVAGTGDATLGGAEVGYQPFSTIGDGSTTYYTIVAVDDNGAPTGDWEVGIGTYILTGNKISRDTVLSSSNGGALVYFPSGTKQIFLDLPSEEVLLSAGDVYGPASAVANNFAAFNMTTGKLIKDSGYNASSFATAAQGALADTAVQPGDLGTAAYLDAGVANGVATLDAGGTVPITQIPASIIGGLIYQGTWNASTNTPTLTSSSGTKGFYYVVSVAGTTNLNGITDWNIGDIAVFNGSVWEQIDNTDAVTSVNGYTGTVVLTATDVGAAPATSGTSILYGNGTGGTSNVTVGSGLTFAGGTLTATGLGGDVVGPASATDNAITRFDTTTGKLIQNSTVTLDDTGNLNQANAITFDTTPGTLPTTPGTLYWDSADGNQTLSLIMANGDATQQIGEEQYFRIKASAPIAEGDVVMFTGTVGASGALTGAPAYGLTASTASYVMGIATHDLATNDWGYVTSFGLVRQLNTNAWTAGTILYLDPTVAGGLTSTIPTAPAPKVQVCAVVYQSSSNGSLFVRPAFGGILGQYEGDVGFTSLANGNLIVRDQTAGKWVNANLGAGTGISVANAAGSVTVTNTAPDQVVSLTGAGTTTVAGTYPSFTITSNDSYTGTVTSVGGTGTVNGITLTGTVTTSGNLTLGGTLSGIGNSQLTNSSVTVNGTTIALGASGTITAANPFALTAGTGISFSSGTTYDGSAAITINSTGSGTVTSVAAGNGMDFSTITGSGTVTLGTPSTITSATTNSASGTTHTHALTVTPANVSDQANTSTGYFDLPAGTTAQRPGSPATGMIRYNTTESKYEVYNGARWKFLNETDYPISVDFLVIAGGGGSGSDSGYYAGGGGAGGFRTSSGTSGGGGSAESALSINASTSYTVTVGAGGAQNANGSNSVFSTVTSTGGGKGGTTDTNGTSGGSGGGAGGNDASTTGGSGTANQGYAGGNHAAASATGGAGGGGAASAGGNAEVVTGGGTGGAGLANSLSGSSVTYAAGGGGMRGFFGFGNNGANGTGWANAANLGHGGAPSVQRAGSSGVVIIKYPDSFTISNPGGGLTYSTTSSGGFKVTTFTAGTGNIQLA